MNRLFTWMALLLVSASVAAAADDAVSRAQAAYEHGDFQAAADLYEKAAAAGYDNGHILYDLGNAYYRSNDTGRAIASYRRALLDLPGDPDVLANLSLARERAKDHLEESSNIARLL